jgi:hypothetical protein
MSTVLGKPFHHKYNLCSYYNDHCYVAVAVAIVVANISILAWFLYLGLYGEHMVICCAKLVMPLPSSWPGPRQRRPAQQVLRDAASSSCRALSVKYYECGRQQISKKIDPCTATGAHIKSVRCDISGLKS